MPPKNYHLQQMIDYMLQAGYSWTEIEEALDIEMQIQTMTATLVEETLYTKSMGEISVNVN